MNSSINTNKMIFLFLVLLSISGGGAEIFKLGESGNETLLLHHNVNICGEKYDKSDKQEVNFITKFHFSPCQSPSRHQIPTLTYSFGLTQYTKNTNKEDSQKTATRTLYIKTIKETKKTCRCQYDYDRDVEDGPPKKCDKHQTSVDVAPPENFTSDMNKIFKISWKRHLKFGAEQDCKVCIPKNDKMEFNYTLHVDAEVITSKNISIKMLYGNYTFETLDEQGQSVGKPTIHQVEDEEGGCGNKNTKNPTAIPPNVKGAVSVVGGFFVAGFVVMVLVSVGFFSHHWCRQRKAKQSSSHDSNQEVEMQVVEMIEPKVEALLAAPPMEVGEVSAMTSDDHQSTEIRHRHQLTPSAPPVSSAPSSTPPTSGTAASPSPTSLSHAPTLRAFCDHPVVIIVWSFLVVANVFALIVSLTVLTWNSTKVKS